MSNLLKTPLAGTLSMVRDKLSIPQGNKSIEISTSSFITIQDLVSHLASKGIEPVEFINTEGQILSPLTHVQTVRHLPLYIKIDQSLYKIIPTGAVCHYSAIDLYDLLTMSPRDRNIVQSHLRHFNSLYNHSELITKEELNKSIHNLVQVGNDEYQENKRKMINMEIERAEMFEEYKNIKKAAEKYARRLLWIGFGITAFQCAYIGIGTYMIHSWDFMEPQAYAINLGNFILAYATYALRRQEMSKDQIFKILTEKKMKQISQINGFDLEKFEEISKELKSLKNKS